MALPPFPVCHSLPAADGTSIVTMPPSGISVPAAPGWLWPRWTHTRHFTIAHAKCLAMDPVYLPVSKPYANPATLRQSRLPIACLVPHFNDRAAGLPDRSTRSPRALDGGRTSHRITPGCSGPHSDPGRTRIRSDGVRSNSGSSAFPAPHALQVLELANHGAAFTNCAPCHAHLYPASAQTRP